MPQQGAMSAVYAMWPRETTAHSGDIVGGFGSPTAKPMSSGFAAESTAVCAGAKNSKSLAARASGVRHRKSPIPGAIALWRRTVRVTQAMWPRVMCKRRHRWRMGYPFDRTKSWRFAGDGAGARGKAGVAKAKPFGGPLIGTAAVSDLWPMQCQETTTRAGEV